MRQADETKIQQKVNVATGETARAVWDVIKEATLRIFGVR